MFVFSLQKSPSPRALLTDEIWNYFTSSVLPAVKMWQLETTSVGGGVSGGESARIINSYLSEIVRKMEENTVSVPKVIVVC